MENFTEKNARFFSRFDSPDVFDCLEFNVLKLVQHAVVRDRVFDVNAFIFLPPWLLKLILFFKRIRYSLRILSGRTNRIKPEDFQKLKNRKYLLIDSSKSIRKKDGTAVSFYFENLLHDLGRDHVVFCQGSLDDSEIHYDILFNKFYDEASILPLTEDDLELIRGLKQTYKNIKSTCRLTSNELNRLVGAIEIFWRQYRAWRHVLKYLNPEMALLISHYQREFIILALKRKKIPVTELQHGLIASEDIFYVYPEQISPIKDRALFADRILVYGEYWKYILLQGKEYALGQIGIIGDYLFHDKHLSEEFRQFAEQIVPQEGKVILITVQKNLEDIFINYVRWLANDLTNKKMKDIILVKPHPNPKKDISALNLLPNVYVTLFNLDWLFSITDIHVSIYSTTLFDALKYSIKNNYSLAARGCEDYVQSIVKSGVTVLLNLNENPVEKMNEKEIALDTRYFYADYKPKLIDIL